MGFDVFAMDTTGYGRFLLDCRRWTIPVTSRAISRQWIPSLLKAVRSVVSARLTTIASDWDDMGAAVDYIRTFGMSIV